MDKKINALILNNEEVRTIITLTNGEVIKVYNPNQEKINEFVDFQTEYFKNNPQSESFDARTVLFNLTPMFTNLDFSELNNENIIKNMINNPSLELQEVKEEIKTIINKINSIKTNSLKNELENIDTKVKQIKLMRDIPQEALDILNKDSKDLINEQTLKKMNTLVSISNKAEEDEIKKNKLAELEEYKKKMKELEDDLNG